MIRKVVRHGTSTLTISLPAKWAKKFGIKAGDEIDTFEVKKNLILSPVPKQGPREELEIDVRSLDNEFIRYILLNLYRAGLDKMRIRLNDLEQGEHIQQCLNTVLLGLEVISKEDGYWILENVTEPTGEKFTMVMRRIFFLTKENLSVIAQDLRQGVFPHAGLIQQQTQKHLQLDAYCKRLINKNHVHYRDRDFYQILLHFVLALDRCCEHCYKFLESQKSVNVGKDTISLLSEIQALFDQFHECFFHHRLDAVGKLTRESLLLKSRHYFLGHSKRPPALCPG
ncbi:AbrB/MazE/SpoVT family DNA-binding domain-containing protein [Candidatus Woesearchaeota archaeon]|nr:AbrB/MazE/SpoVT family DNA-binding domain-containing protein [Candidatus Woesearchaeota archaeon]